MVKRPMLILTVGLILFILGAHYLEIEFCAPFNLEKIFSTVSECKIIGTVIAEQKPSEYYNKYIVKIENIYSEGKSVTKLKNTKVLLKIKRANTLEVGNKIYFDTTIEIPKGARNYGGYDYKLYLKTLGIYAIVESELNNIEIIQNNNFSFIDNLVYKFKSKVINNLKTILNSDTQGLAIGILLGDDNFISDEIKQSFKQSNLSHILAVSGAHVAYLIIGVTKCIKKVDKRIQKVVLIMLLLFFIKLTGASSSVTRAGIMGILFVFAQICKRKSDVINNIAISCFIILLVNPYNLYNLGFQLSYAGTLGIILFYDILNNAILKKVKTFNFKIHYINAVFKKLTQYIISTIVVTISANILILPILIYNFNNCSLVFLISNLLVSNLFGIIMIFGFIIILISLFSINIAHFFAPVLDVALNILIQCSEISNKLNFFNITVPTPSIIEVSLIYIIIFTLRKGHISNNKIYKNLVKCVLLIFLIYYIMSFIMPNFTSNMKLHFIDVGQGDCTLVITDQNKKVLIDGGGTNTGFDVGKQTLLPYLLDRKIVDLDFVLISHFDSDHCKGIFTVLENLKVKYVCVSEKGQQCENYNTFLQIVKSKNLKVIYLKPGDVITIDKYTRLEILWTGEDEISDNIINNFSITCSLIYHNTKILFTGDIEEIAEKKIVNIYKNNKLKSDILKVAHHGSKTSSTQEIINKINPKIVLIGVGENNNFGHPNETVLNSFKELRCGYF